MGNQLVGIAPSQIFPVERYLTDYPDLKFDKSLGSTRFLKVARAESQEGLVVVKIFAIHDPSLPLLSHKDRLEEIRKKLTSAINCIPFQRIILTDKAGLIMREYVKYSLYDRISTRPFLTNIEKRWITFQILYALHQCHKVGVCHGDIKLENIMVTSWNWVLLVDFASFKPTFLPENNPADYSYFFDTSRRRTCYIAPERFVEKSTSESNILFSESPCDSGALTPAMDIFSAGCALLELWNELHIAFEYSQLLEYRSNIYSPETHLNKIGDPSLRSLISSMISLDPSKRLSAEDYLAQERGRLFPEYFFSFLQSYMLIFSSTPILSSDEKILRLKKDIVNIFMFLGPVKHTEESYEKCDDTEKVSRGECEGLVLITSLVTSCIRGLHDCSSKLYSLEILLELANHASDETVLDRILPYLMYLAHDPMARVKMSAINTITQCLDLVKKLPRSDANIFPEYILPGLAPLASDPKTCVRAAYAKNIAKLAEISYRYLEQIQNDWYEQDTIKIKDGPVFNFELELQVLHEMIQQTVSSLLTDTQTIVKQTLMHSGITELCVFFGKQKANDVILSHMITYLNDKEDKELRGSFFDCMIGVASYIGWHCSYILKPLLQQGLTDCSEFVSVKAINAMSQLTELGLISKPDLCELITDCVSFLVHPNLWIRLAVAGFISTAAKTLSVLDVQCKMMPKLMPYLKHQLIQIERPEFLLNALVNPIPRQVYDSVIAYSEIDMLLDMLRNRKAFRDNIKTGKIVSDFSKDVDTSLKNLLRRLEANGMKEEIEEHVLKLGPFLKKISKHKSSADAHHNKQNEGRIELNSATSPVRSHVFGLNDSQKNEFLANRRLHRTNTSGSIDTNINSDWNYSSEMLAKQSESTNSGGPPSRSTNSRPSSPPHDGNTPFVSTDPSSNISLHERSYIHYRRSSCYFELLNLKSRQQEHYFEAFRNKEYAEQVAWQPILPPPGWHIKGTLVAHLHEHKNAVNRLCPVPDSPLFASCASDGYVRLWDCAKMEGKNIANRSRQHYKMLNGCNIPSLAACECGQSLAAPCEDGSINILRIDPASSKMSLVQTKQLDKDDEGFVVELQCMDSGSQSVLIYATLYGSMIGWDLRAPGTVFRLENGMRDGVITSFCVDPYQNWLAVGMNSNLHNIWDLRFHLKINTIEHPAVNSKIRRVICHPTEPSWIISSIHGNNEVSMWNLETRFRENVLWGSTEPPLSNVTPKNRPLHAVTAMLAGCIDHSPFLITGGTDQRVRFWNLASSSQSYLVVPAACDTTGTTLKYENRLIDGTNVVLEQMKEVDFKSDTSSPSTSRTKDKEDFPRAGPEPPPAGHRDSISDLILCKASQCFLITSSRDGIIKVWK